MTYFCFTFIDGLYYWTYDKNHKFNYIRGGGNDRSGMLNRKECINL